MVYKTKILPYFDYADILCIGSYRLTLKKLQKQQNRALRICLRLGSHTKVKVSGSRSEPRLSFFSRT